MADRFKHMEGYLSLFVLQGAQTIPEEESEHYGQFVVRAWMFGSSG